MKRLPQNQIVVPRRTRRRFYGYGIPKVDLDRLAGRLIVVEGADGSGRSTQIEMLVEWLEGGGHATVQVGLNEGHRLSSFAYMDLVRQRLRCETPGHESP